MPIKFAELTVSHNNTGVFSTVYRLFGREEYFTKESIMVFLFDDGEVRDVNATHEDYLYTFTYLTTINSYYPSYFDKVSGNTYFCRRPEQIEGTPRLDFRNLFKEHYKNNHIPSIYNCIYYCYGNLSRTSSSKNDVFGILRYKSSEHMPRFEIAYDSDEFTKEDIIHITRKLLLGNNS